jgi:predicted O-methyltransferase YrrM
MSIEQNPHTVFEKLLEIARQNYDESLIEYFQKQADRTDFIQIEKLGYETQIVIKKSDPNFNHGFLLSAELSKYIKQLSRESHITILDIGTARGFSALVMAYILAKFPNQGEVITIDITSHYEKRKWNSVLDDEKGISRNEIFDLYEYSRRIIPIQGKSTELLPKLGVKRVNFAFIDGDHNWRSLRQEIDFIRNRQQRGDIICFDDATPSIYPDVIKAAESLSDEYVAKVHGDPKKRGYLVLTHL